MRERNSTVEVRFTPKNPPPVLSSGTIFAVALGSSSLRRCRTLQHRDDLENCSDEEQGDEEWRMRGDNQNSKIRHKRLESSTRRMNEIPVLSPFFPTAHTHTPSSISTDAAQQMKARTFLLLSRDLFFSPFFLAGHRGIVFISFHFPLLSFASNVCSIFFLLLAVCMLSLPPSRRAQIDSQNPREWRDRRRQQHNNEEDCDCEKKSCVLLCAIPTTNLPPSGGTRLEWSERWCWAFGVYIPVQYVIIECLQSNANLMSAMERECRLKRLLWVVRNELISWVLTVLFAPCCFCTYLIKCKKGWK